MRRLSLETILDIQVFLKFVVSKGFNKNCFKTNFVVFLSTRSLKIVNRYSRRCDNHLDKVEKSTKPVKRIKWWKLKDSKVKYKFKMEVIESGILGGKEDWQRVVEMLRSNSRMELGETSGKISMAGRRET